MSEEMIKTKIQEDSPMKTPEELNALKEELETLNKKLAELTEEELSQVAGGVQPDVIKPNVNIKPYSLECAE